MKKKEERREENVRTMKYGNVIMYIKLKEI
jgi:hypothetical protein